MSQSNNYACCNNPTMKYRSAEDVRMKNIYCPLSLNADTNLFYNPKIAEGFCTGNACYNSPTQFYNEKKAYQFNGKTGPQVIIAPGTYGGKVVEGYCACEERSANVQTSNGNGTPLMAPCGKKNMSGYIGVAGV